MKLRCKFFDKEVYPDGLQRIGDNKSDWIDLRAREETLLDEGEIYYIPLGVAIELPKGYEALVVPRSSTANNYGLMMPNSIGVIDESYCGDEDEWHFPVYATCKSRIPKGESLCQFRIIKHQPELEFEEVLILGNKNRRGLGSTGRK